LAVVHRALRQLRGGRCRSKSKAQAAAHEGGQARGRRQEAGERAQRCRVPLGSIIDLRKGDVFLVEASEVVPADGEVIEGVASVDESAITGESAP
jgi:K+-transporting ATPase ATPase B chain